MVNNIYNLRGVIGKELAEKIIKNFSKSVVDYLHENNCSKSIIIGKDNRVSSDYILSVIQSVLLANGINVYTIGISTTPELVFMTNKFRFSLGIMITASHNPKEYNGIKCFNSLGEVVDINIASSKKRVHKKYEHIIDITKFKELYLQELKGRLNSNKFNCIFDCANGATIDVVRNIFPSHKIIGNESSGQYINDGCGSESLDAIKKICKQYQKIGFAFDGDGDRVVAIDSDGTVIDGDKILYIIASQQLGSGDTVIGTQISSLSLEIALKKLGIELIREKVGAKYVGRRLIKEKAKLGGENCGHIFIPKSISSDGVMVAIELLNTLNRTGLSYKELLKGYKDFYKISRSIDIKNVKNVCEYEQLTQNLHIVVRKSGTEPKLRVFIESVDKELAYKELERIINSME